MTVKLTASKVQEIIDICIDAKAQKYLKIRQVAKVIGKLVAAMPAVQYGQLHYRQLEIEKTMALRNNRGNFNNSMKLSNEAKEELDWWINMVSSSCRSINQGKADLELETDASGLGWSSTDGNEQIGGVLNVIADDKSRNFDDHTEWMLNKDMFKQVCDHFGTPEIDIFASRLNAQLPRYVSWKPDPGAEGIFCNHQLRTGLRLRYFVVVYRSPSTSSPVARSVSAVVWRSIVWQSYISAGVPEKALPIIMSSWRESTRKQYAVHIRHWLDFCCREQCNPVQADVTYILTFLTEIHENFNLGYSALNTAQNALSSFILSPNGQSVGNHSLVKRFMKGIFNLQPPQPRYTHIWDVRVVLNVLRKLSPVETLGLRDLTYKLSMLIALTSTQRIETLHKLQIADLKMTDNSACFHVKELVKQSRPGHVGTIVRLSAYPPDRRLCVFKYLQHYLNKTKDLRKSGESHLFISFRRPYARVSKDTISRWIRTVMELAEVDTTKYKPHSTRAASTSTLNNSTVPESQILNAAGWAREETFRKLYNKPVEQNMDGVSSAILDTLNT
ncbi:uncharacterized protein [Amphiura filiformis]|uniref:uncharacterized protein n=1 Tax=Amphiura filiformis TaxID=82378 RepID=UPI003B2124F1